VVLDTEDDQAMVVVATQVVVPADTEVLEAQEVQEVLKAHVVLLDGEARATRVDTDMEVLEDDLDGMDEDGTAAMVLGDHLDGEDPDTILDTAQISLQAGDQVGYLFHTTTSFRSRFLSQMVHGATTLTDPTSMPDLILTTVLKSSTIRAVMI